MLLRPASSLGDQCKAAATAVPQVIGNIQTAIGCGTLTRANGVAVQVIVGDPVCQGDVIETAADGRSEFASSTALCSTCPTALARC